MSCTIPVTAVTGSHRDSAPRHGAVIPGGSCTPRGPAARSRAAARGERACRAWSSRHRDTPVTRKNRSSLCTSALALPSHPRCGIILRWYAPPGEALLRPWVRGSPSEGCLR